MTTMASVYAAHFKIIKPVWKSHHPQRFPNPASMAIKAQHKAMLAARSEKVNRDLFR
jgi:hypothetical protein